MTALDFATLMKDYGSVGLNAILFYAVVKLYNGKETLHEKVTEIFGKALIAIEASTAALVESRGSDKALADTIDKLAKALDELSRESEGHSTAVRHGLNNVSQSMVGIREKLGSICGLIEQIPEKVKAAVHMLMRGP